MPVPVGTGTFVTRGALWARGRWCLGSQAPEEVSRSLAPVYREERYKLPK
ncbi:hypothetical protein L519_0872 [Bordetella bronchiseptica MBORD678]|nr:hypothetical protein L519_0872 [Bordetella bronchiseptica MBORD678]